MTKEARLYGVSSGNGNDGVSHMFPDYYVKTDDPWRLARLAAVTDFKPGEGQAWALENMEVDGEAEYTITVTFYESPEFQEEAEAAAARHSAAQEALDAYTGDEDATEFTELVAERDEAESEFDNYSDGPAYAWAIYEVFPEDEPREGRPTYDSIEACFGDDAALVPVEQD